MRGLFPRQFAPAVSEVRAALTADSEFAQSERYRWAFGREAALRPGTHGPHRGQADPPRASRMPGQSERQAVR
jgi:hypothetical protein